MPAFVGKPAVEVSSPYPMTVYRSLALLSVGGFTAPLTNCLVKNCGTEGIKGFFDRFSFKKKKPHTFGCEKRRIFSRLALLSGTTNEMQNNTETLFHSVLQPE